jgi:hypothetical protein
MATTLKGNDDTGYGDGQHYLFVSDNGFDLQCPKILGREAWRCAGCRRGVLHSWDKKCKVCKRTARYMLAYCATISNRRVY